jgi:hypothetical protein
MQEALRLEGPWPNPVEGAATVRFAVRESQEARVQVYNVLGQEVATLWRGEAAGGESVEVRLGEALTGLASGTYFLRLQAGDRTEIEQFTLLR